MPAIHDAHATMFGLARHGELYERWAGRLAGRLYARVTADLLAAALPTGARILDAGTGPGLLPLRIAAACPQLTVDAVDLSPQMIDRARQSAASAGQDEAVTFTVADVAALPFPDATFDLVVSNHQPAPLDRPRRRAPRAEPGYAPRCTGVDLRLPPCSTSGADRSPYRLAPTSHQPAEPAGRHLAVQPHRPTRAADRTPNPSQLNASNSIGRGS
jgi:SAM-dependent methyltransferase